jgi:hypothetical protein
MQNWEISHDTPSSHLKPDALGCQIWGEMNFCDFFLVAETCSGSVPQAVAVHRVVLSSASEVFARLVSGAYREKKDCTVVVPCNEAVLRVFLEFIYCGCFHSKFSGVDCRQLWNVAEQYQVKGIQSFLLTKIDKKNVIPVLCFAVRRSDLHACVPRGTDP